MNDVPGGRPPPPGGYGAPEPPPQPGPAYASRPTPYGQPWPPGPTVARPAVHALAIVSLVLGFIQCIPGSGLAAIVCGIMARGAVRREPYRYSGDTLALVGIILGGIHAAIWVAYLVMVVGFGIWGAMLR